MRVLLVTIMLLVALAPTPSRADDAAPPATTSSAAAPPAATSSAPAASSTSSAAVTTPAAPNTFLSNLVDGVLKISAAVILVFGTWGAHRVITYFEDKTGIVLPASTETLIDGWCQQGIALAEQKASVAIKTKTQAIAGSDKLQIATNFVWSLVQQYGLVDYAQTTIVSKIEALLGMQTATATSTAPATTPIAPVPPAPIRAA